MKLIILFLLSFNSYAFFWSNNSMKNVDPLTLKTQKERMLWLKENDKELFDTINKKQSREKNSSINSVWKNYEKEAEKLYDPNKEKREKEKRIREMKEAMKKKMKENEEKLKQGYRLVNGKLISKEEQEKLKQDKEQKKLETKRVLDFYKEMDMELPKNPTNIDVKDE